MLDENLPQNVTTKVTPRPTQPSILIGGVVAMIRGVHRTDGIDGSGEDTDERVDSHSSFTSRRRIAPAPAPASRCYPAGLHLRRYFRYAGLFQAYPTPKYIPFLAWASLFMM